MMEFLFIIIGIIALYFLYKVVRFIAFIMKWIIILFASLVALVCIPIIIFLFGVLCGNAFI